MARKQTLIHFHTSTGNVETVKSAITKGEIVVKHADDKPELYIKKDNGDIATFIDKTAIETIVTTINGEVDAVIGDVSALKAFSGHVATNFATKSVASGYATTAKSEAIAAAKNETTTQVGALSGTVVTRFNAVEADVTALEGFSGHVATNFATKTDAQGYASTAKSEAIGAAKTETTNQVKALSGAVVTRITAVEADVTALEDFSGHVATNFATKAVASGYATTAKSEAVAAAKTETTNQVKALSGAVVTRFNAVEADVTALEGFSGHVATNFATKTDAQGYASTAKSEAIAAAKTETTNQVEALSGAVVTRVAAIEGNVSELFGEDGGKSVREIAVEELTKQLVASGASENLNELKEIAAWIQQHPKDAAAMNSNIQTISSHTANLISSANTTSTKISAIEADVTALENFSGHVATNFATKTDAQGYASTAKSEAIGAAKTETTTQVKALSGAVVTRFTAVEADVTALEGFSGHVATNFATKAVASGYADTAKSEAVNAAKSETTTQVKALSGAVVTRFTAVEADVTALEGFSGHVASNFATKAVASGYATTAKGEAVTAAKNETTTQVKALSGAVVTRFTAVEADVTALENFSGHVASNFATKAVASGYATTAKGEAVTAAKNETTTQVGALSGAVVTRFTAVEGDVTTIKNNVLYNIDVSGISGVTATKNGTTETINFTNMVIDCGDF